MKYLNWFILLASTSVLFAQEPDSASALYQMREAERSFAKASVMFGRKAAFAEFLAEKSVIFTDKWITTGKQFWQKRPANPVILKWEPEYMDISSGRDFGISTGPWEAQEYRPNTQVLSTGYFLSVWEKQKDDTWKVILDYGTNTPKPAGPLHSFSFPSGEDKGKANNAQKFNGGLPEAENKMLASWKKEHNIKTYNSFLRNDARIMMEGCLPTVKRDTLNLWLEKNSKSFEWRQSGTGTSSLGDMGFTYGYVLLNGETKGNYVRIWKKDPEKNWQIIIDLLSPY